MADPLSFLWSKEFITGALTGGGLVTIWKWVAGWHRVNLSLVIENRRTLGASRGTDELVCVLKMKKGDRATLALETIHFAVVSSQREIASGMVEEINLTQVARTLNMTPGEETRFAFHCQPPSNAICKVTATVTGRSLRKWAPLSVWKTTEFSVPLPPIVPANTET